MDTLVVYPHPPSASTPLATLAYRVLVLSLAALAVVAQLVHLDSLYWNFLGFAGAWAGQTTSSFLTVAVMDAVLTAVSGVVAVVLVFRGDPKRGAFPLAAVLSTWSYLLAYSAVVTFLRPANPASSARMVFEAHFLLIEMVGLGALVRFASTFPRALTRDDLLPPGDVPVVLRPLQYLRRALLSPVNLWLSVFGGVVAALFINEALARPAQDAALLPVVDVVRFAALALVVSNFRRSYLLAEPPQRRTLHWLALGFAILVGSLCALIGGNVLLTVTGWTVPVINWRPVVLGVGVIGMIGGCAKAVLTDGSTDPTSLVRRAMILSALTLATLLLAAGFEALLSDAVVARLSLPGGLGTMAAIGVMSIIHTRLRQPLENVFDQAWGGLSGS